MPGDRVRSHIWVTGRVQGVFFRQETARRARSRGVSGWVRNLADGRVEAILEGPPEDVAAVVEWAAAGPPMAHVEHMEVEEETPEGENGFRIR
jgi:acylphosphatase